MKHGTLLHPSLSGTDTRDRILGCWLGKAVGGTLGMPFEGESGPLDLSFYSPVPTKMLPNDDLDLQVVWACVMDAQDTVTVDRHLLARAWLDHVQFPWDEYGVAIRNLRNGLQPPLSGSFDNWFTHSMGAPIRSEIWACLAPGQPKLAAAYAYEDACVDHGGEGVWAEVFLAALQSAAFVQSDPAILLPDALGLLPAACRTRLAVEDTMRWWQESGDWKTIRGQILAAHGRDNFTDAPMNIAFTVLGWLAGGDDFSRTICIAVNCGMDTDCTGATAGALMGILDPEGIPQRWIDPIGRSLVLSKGIVGLEAPSTIDDFTDLVIGLRERLQGKTPRQPVRDAVQEQVDSQVTNSLKIGVEIGYVDQMPASDPAPQILAPMQRTLPGTVGEMAASEFQGDVLLVRYQIHIADSLDARVMMNTPEACRVWIDGVFAFGRDGGVMAPSFHRVPNNQFADIVLSRGAHELVAAIKRPATRSTVEWVVGVGDRQTMQWVPACFCAP